ncbi:E3 ubiquitin-protein ligase SMURF1 [Striga asiatica]|uniref:E3 ubiquitin-protein ligase SMURF1 n=1 Tax=Striga asiatica TaxID=4170 RepID=A0A5A7QPB2_STRAF|nr:E3 ubiquitin-protein ligase SMURF1 [Striga asiatica]
MVRLLSLFHLLPSYGPHLPPCKSSGAAGVPTFGFERRDANCDGLPVAGLGLGRVDGEKYGPNPKSRRGRLVGLWRGGGFGGGRRLATIRMVAHTSYAFNG